MTNTEKLHAGKDIFSTLSAGWGPETELGRPVKLELDVKIEHKNGKPGYCLSICGYLRIKDCDKLGLKYINSGGQCEDHIINDLAINGLRCRSLEKIVPIWVKWHLNDTHAGTESQENYLAQYQKDHPDWKYCYSEVCEILKKANLYSDHKYKVNGKPYSYGTSWLFREIPYDVLNELCNILDSEFEIEQIKKDDQ